MELTQNLERLWNVQETWKLIPLERGYFNIHFEHPDTSERVLRKRSWRVQPRVIHLQRWIPGFNLLRVVTSLTQVWVRLRDLPMEYWIPSVLGSMAAAISTLIKIDNRTLWKIMGRYAPPSGVSDDWKKVSGKRVAHASPPPITSNALALVGVTTQNQFDTLREEREDKGSGDLGDQVVDQTQVGISPHKLSWAAVVEAENPQDHILEKYKDMLVVASDAPGCSREGVRDPAGKAFKKDKRKIPLTSAYNLRSKSQHHSFVDDTFHGEAEFVATSTENNAIQRWRLD
ncbi:hypothetical protein ACS0TY_003796 [Phlomoides rotata]